MTNRSQSKTIRAAVIANLLPQQRQVVQRIVVPVFHRRLIEAVRNLQSLALMGGTGKRHENSGLRKVHSRGIPEAGRRALTAPRARSVSLEVVSQPVQRLDAVRLTGGSHFLCERARDSPARLVGGVHGAFEPRLPPLRGLGPPVVAVEVRAGCRAEKDFWKQLAVSQAAGIGRGVKYSADVR